MAPEHESWENEGGAIYKTPPTPKQFDTFNQILAYEGGELTEEETIALFQNLVDSGMAWKLQGSYGRTAVSLIRAGLVHDHEHDVTPAAGISDFYAMGES